MRRTSLAIAGVLVACGGSQKPDHRSYAQRMEDANKHEQRARAHEQVAAMMEPAAPQNDTFACGDMALNDQLTTGGLRVTTWQPCADIEADASGHHALLAAEERERARHDRHGAEKLVQAEIAACGTLTKREQEHSPFAHRRAIAEVIPHREAGELRGVRVVFKPIAGLTADWVKRSIACQQAHWALVGRDPKVAPDDPTLVDGAKVEVSDRGGRVEVLVTAPAEQAEIALARAQGELTPTASTADR